MGSRMSSLWQLRCMVLDSVFAVAARMPSIINQKWMAKSSPYWTWKHGQRQQTHFASFFGRRSAHFSSHLLRSELTFDQKSPRIVFFVEEEHYSNIFMWIMSCWCQLTSDRRLCVGTTVDFLKTSRLCLFRTTSCVVPASIWKLACSLIYSPLLANHLKHTWGAATEKVRSANSENGEVLNAWWTKIIHW